MKTRNSITRILWAFKNRGTIAEKQHRWLLEQHIQSLRDELELTKTLLDKMDASKSKRKTTPH